VKLRWLSNASLDLDEVFEYIADDDPDAAAGQLLLILESVEHLLDNPSMGRPGRVPHTRELIVSNYVVAYRVKDQVIQILRVLHQSRKWPDKL
jgi:toxin ParE1/3/4